MGQPLKKHVILWSFALSAAAVALGLYYVRTAPERAETARRSNEELVHWAMEYLKDDPSMADQETQAYIRAVAVEVDAGRIISSEGDYLLAMQYQRESNFAQAEAMFRGAILRAPNWSLAHAGLGNLLGRYQQGRLEEAEREIRAAIGLAPNWGRAQDLLAFVLQEQDRMEEAEVAAKKAVELAPKNVAHINNYGMFLLQMGRFDEAEVEFKSAMNLDKENPRPPYNLARLFAFNEELKEALENLREALSRAPNFRTEAQKDPYFDKIRWSKEFQRMIAEPAKADTTAGPAKPEQQAPGKKAGTAPAKKPATKKSGATTPEK
jgi:Flp pilus assembly protein TadD